MFSLRKFFWFGIILFVLVGWLFTARQDGDDYSVVIRFG